MNNPRLVDIYRGEVLESFHRGVICIVDSEGKIIYSKGNTQQMCYPRSALKFFQQIPLLTHKDFNSLGLSTKEIAITCGSHNGEEEHIQTVQSILNKIGLTENDLMCGAQMPTLRNDQNFLIKNDLEPRKIMNNCSGKHAGFLAYCVLNNLPTKNYIDLTHPLHQKILNVISDFHEYPKKQILSGIDGCSAPIFAFPVYNQAIAYKNLCSKKHIDSTTQNACNLMIEAVSQYPSMIAGTNRYCTELMREAKGKLIGKTGADGIYSIGVLEPNIGITIKIDDGKMGPQYNVAQAIIENLGILSKESCNELQKYKEQENKNFGGLQTGVTCVCSELNTKINL